MEQFAHRSKSHLKSLNDLFLLKLLLIQLLELPKGVVVDGQTGGSSLMTSIGQCLSSDVWGRRDRNWPLDARSLHVWIPDQNLAAFVEKGHHGVRLLHLVMKLRVFEVHLLRPKEARCYSVVRMLQVLLLLVAG